MRTTPIGRQAVYDPAMLMTLGVVFDEAWNAIAGNFDAGSREAARLRLATIVLQLMADGDCHPLELKCRAIGAMQLPFAT